MMRVDKKLQPHGTITKGERAVSALLDAALALLGANRSSELTPGLICQQASMKRTSFYTYFHSIDDVMDAVCAREIDSLEAAYLHHNADNDSPLSRIVRIPLYIYARARHEKGWFKAISHSMTWNRKQREARLTHLRADVEAAIAARQINITSDQIDAFIFLYIAAIFSLVDNAHIADAQNGTATKALQLVLQGAGADADRVVHLLATPIEGDI